MCRRIRPQRHWRLDAPILPSAMAAALALLLLAGCGGSSRAAREACIRNLVMISGAKDRYALEHEGASPARLEDLTPYVEAPPVCPKGGIYKIGAYAELPTCSVQGHQLGEAASRP